MPKITRPNNTEYAPYFSRYADKVAGDDAFATLAKAAQETVAFFESIPAEQWDYSYAPGKWTLKESIIHMLDTERIFAYRALRIARNDQTPLMGFEQDDYVPYYNAQQRSSESVIAEYKAVRSATLELFRYLNPEDLMRVGTSGNMPVSVRALAYLIAGHEIHHLALAMEQYLS